MPIHFALIAAATALLLLLARCVHADEPSAFASDFDVQDFYRPFALEEITPKNQQKWPYYKYVSSHWDAYAGHGTVKVGRSGKPAKLEVAKDRLDLNTEYEDGKSYIDSFVDTQVKGFVVMKDNKILAEYYDNGFNVGDTNLLQSSSKTFVGVITHRLIEEGLLDPSLKVTGRNSRSAFRERSP